MVDIVSVPLTDPETEQVVDDRHEILKVQHGALEGNADIEAGKADFAALEAYMLEKGEIAPNPSGRQEMLENLVNRFI